MATPKKVALARADTPDVFVYEFDATVSHSYQSDVDLTDFPVETGSVISDHVIIRPREITFDIWQTDIGKSEAQDLAFNPTSTSSARNLYADLLVEQRIGALFTIETDLVSAAQLNERSLALYVPYLYAITSIQVEKNSSTGKAVHISNLTLRQVAIVSNKVSNLPRTTKTAGKKSSGQCQPGTPNDAEKAKAAAAAKAVRGTSLLDLGSAITGQSLTGGG